MKAPIFIVGLHRSGSTLWHNLISMSPGLLRLTEMRMLSYWWQDDVASYIKSGAGDLSRDENVEKMVQVMFAKGSPRPRGLEGAFWRFEYIDLVTDPVFQRSVAQAIKKSDRKVGSIFRITIDELTRASGQERACVKFPLDVGHLPKLFQWYPGCKVVHITRDPRAMAMSRTNDPGGTAIKVQQHPKVAALIRRAAVGLVLQQYCWTAKLHDRYKTFDNYGLFQYEDLLANPEETLRRVCAFAECEFVPQMLQPERGKHLHQASSITGKQQLGFDRKAASRWLEIISPMDRWMISAVTRKSMRTFGYFPENHPLFART